MDGQGGCDIDDQALLPRHEGGHRSLRQACQRCDIQGDLGLRVVSGRLGSRSQARNTGVVHQDLYVPTGGQNLLDPRQVLVFGQIGRNRLGFDTVRLGDLRGEGFQAVSAPGDKDKIVSTRGEAIRIDGADAGRSPCNKSDFLRTGICHDGFPIKLRAQLKG